MDSYRLLPDGGHGIKFLKTILKVNYGAAAYVVTWRAHNLSLQDDADVLACAVDPITHQVVVLDAYNVPNRHKNVRDTIQVRRRVVYSVFSL